MLTEISSGALELILAQLFVLKKIAENGEIMTDPESNVKVEKVVIQIDNETNLILERWMGEAYTHNVMATLYATQNTFRSRGIACEKYKDRPVVYKFSFDGDGLMAVEQFSLEEKEMHLKDVELVDQGACEIIRVNPDSSKTESFPDQIRRAIFAEEEQLIEAVILEVYNNIAEKEIRLVRIPGRKAAEKLDWMHYAFFLEKATIVEVDQWTLRIESDYFEDVMVYCNTSAVSNKAQELLRKKYRVTKESVDYEKAAQALQDIPKMDPQSIIDVEEVDNLVRDNHDIGIEIDASKIPEDAPTAEEILGQAQQKHIAAKKEEKFKGVLEKTPEGKFDVHKNSYDCFACDLKNEPVPKNLKKRFRAGEVIENHKCPECGAIGVLISRKINIGKQKKNPSH